MIVSRKHIEYLQRSDSRPEPILPISAAAEVRTELQCLSRIRAVGMDSSKLTSAEAMQTPSSDLSTSLYAASISIAYLVLGRGDAVEVYLGNWQRGAPSSGLTEVMHARQDIIVAGLKSLYPASDLKLLDANSKRDLMSFLSTLRTSGFVLGLPTVKPAPREQSSYPLDRVIRSLKGSDWACLLLAEPVAESLLNKQRDDVIEELKDTADSPKEKPNILGAYYTELLNLRLQTLSTSLGSGAWRAAIYLLGNASYYRLASVWRGVFSGEDALLEPIRVWQTDVSSLVGKWAMSNTEAHPGPGRVRRLLEHQTILSSAQLAAYLHLPRVETNGFSIKRIASFGAAPQSVGAEEQRLNIGKVLSRDNLVRSNSSEDNSEQNTAEADRKYFEQLPNTYYYVRPKALTQHVFVAGVTGSGKTTTIFNLLKEALALDVPFLVIEPAKTEYRDLLNHREVGKRLQVFTLADEQISPFRLNPFEVLPGTSISKHIDLIRSLFSASFGLWTPLPQILEECLYLIYQDRGWDLAGDFNLRLEDRSNDRADPMAFPTLSDLLVKVDEVTSKLQWDPEAIARIRGSLRDRLRSLQKGGRGRMLDVQRSLPMQAILDHPTVLELEAEGDDDDKAFMMGLLLIRLAEYRRTPKDRFQAASRPGLRHLLVFEEAHRLLANVAHKSEEGAANPRAKGVETFGNLLSEIRAYGQGVIIADQVPVKLAPDVIKNTNLKIAHRVVDLEDRKLLGGSMVMTDEQVETVSKLLRGTAAVFSEGDDSPLLMQVKPGPDPKPARPEDETIKSHMDGSKVLKPHRDVFARHADCADTGENSGPACDTARDIVDNESFQRDFTRLVLSLMDDPTAIQRLWPPIESHINASVSPFGKKEVIVRCVIARAAEWYAFRRGSQAAWPYSKTQGVVRNLSLVLLRRNEPEELRSAISSLQNCIRDLHKRVFPPYSGCERICRQTPSECLYRHAVRDVIDKGDFTQAFRSADPANSGEKTGPLFAWWICQRVAQQLVEPIEVQRDTLQRIGLCYGQMMLRADTPLMAPEERNEVLEMICKESSNMKLRAL